MAHSKLYKLALGGYLVGVSVLGYVFFSPMVDQFRRKGLFEEVCQKADTNHDGYANNQESTRAVKVMMGLQEEPYISKYPSVSNIPPVNETEEDRGTLTDLGHTFFSIDEMKKYLNSK